MFRLGPTIYMADGLSNSRVFYPALLFYGGSSAVQPLICGSIRGSLNSFHHSLRLSILMVSGWRRGRPG